MSNLNIRAFQGLAKLIVLLALLLFLPAWNIYYWQAWAFLAVFGICVLMITIYLMRKDAKLLERRMSIGSAAEKEKSQKLIQAIAASAFVAIFVISSLDHRFEWSMVASYVVGLGDVLVALGLFIVFLVFKENTFTSAIIEIDTTQKVISTGPYAWVRHPMYTGAFIMLLGVPLALGSRWGLLPVLVVMAVIVWRLREEEKFLVKNLPGYVEYKNKLAYRLIPFVW
jgi:protein-S-isoprenylcysteine O-methyltransferase Ste14